MTETDAWGNEPLERPRYHMGMLLAADDFGCEQTYHRRAHAAFVRAVHGAGTVCGLAVRPTDPPSREVAVDSGLAIDGLGRQMIVPDVQTLALGDLGGSGGDTVRVVAIRFVEVPTGHVPVRPEVDVREATEPSRVVESFELFLASVRVLDAHDRRSPRATPPVSGEELHAWLVDRAIEPCRQAVDVDAGLPLAVVTVPPAGSITSDHIDNTVRPIVLTVDLVAQLGAELQRTSSPNWWRRLRDAIGHSARR